MLAPRPWACKKRGRENDTEASSGCEESRRLLDAFSRAVKELLVLRDRQFVAVVEGDAESARFDPLIDMAKEKKQQAKEAYLRHVEAHGCSNG
jgi:hypothetical protein